MIPADFPFHRYYGKLKRGDTNEPFKFIAEGHAIESRYSGGGKKVVTYFFNAGEYMIPSYPDCRIEELDKVTFAAINFTDQFRLLRQFDDSRMVFAKIREAYWERVRTYEKRLASLTPQQHLRLLLDEKPWVRELAEKKDIASFLRISEFKLSGFYQ